MAENTFTVSGKKNECSIASARSKCCCASGVHDVLKCTRPNVSSAGLVCATALDPWASAPPAIAPAIRLTAIRRRPTCMRASQNLCEESRLPEVYASPQQGCGQSGFTLNRDLVFPEARIRLRCTLLRWLACPTSGPTPSQAAEHPAQVRPWLGLLAFARVT